MSQINTLFISYRRADNPIFVERIRDWLIARYQRDRVFMDFDSIPSFTRFQTFIEKKIAASDAVIVIIGPEWLKLLKEKESSGEIDYVRIEIEAALKLNKLIAPIRILDAPMPHPADLPPSLRPLCEINAPVLNAGTHFLDNIERILKDLESAYGEHVAPAVLPMQPIRAARAAPVLQSRSMDADEVIYYIESLNLEPKHGDFQVSHSAILYKNDDIDSAIIKYTEEIRRKPDHPDAYFYRGVARTLTNDNVGAIIDLREALRLKYSNIKILKSLIAYVEKKLKQGK